MRQASSKICGHSARGSIADLDGVDLQLALARRRRRAGRRRRSTRSSGGEKTSAFLPVGGQARNRPRPAATRLALALAEVEALAAPRRGRSRRASGRRAGEAGHSQVEDLSGQAGLEIAVVGRRLRQGHDPLVDPVEVDRPPAAAWLLRPCSRPSCLAVLASSACVLGLLGRLLGRLLLVALAGQRRRHALAQHHQVDRSLARACPRSTGRTTGCTGPASVEARK